jgi:hypothetical protein
MRALSSAELFAAYHSAGHAIAAGAIEELSRGVPNRRPPLQDALFEGWLNFTASGHAAEKELACRLGLRWRRVVSNAGDDLEACRLLIGEQTGEDHRDWILLHWTRAVARASRLLTANWSEVVKLAELQASYHRGADPLCPAKALTEVGHSRTDCWNRWWDEAIRRRRDDRYRPTGGYLAHDRAERRPLQGSRSGGVSGS